MAIAPSIGDPKAVFRYADILIGSLDRLCGSLPPEAQDALMCQIQLLQLDVGETLYRQGETGEDMHIVLTGRLEVRVDAEQGTQRVLAHPQPGDVLGEIALLAGSPRAATVVAIRDTTLGVLPRSALEALINDDPEIFSRIARMIISRMSGTQGHIARRTGVRTLMVVPLHDSLNREIFGAGLRSALLRFGSVLYLDSRAAAARALEHGTEDYGRLLDECERSYDYVVLEADPVPSAWSRKCYGYADRIILAADASMLPLRTSLEHWLFEQDSRREACAEADLVLVHDPQEQPRGTRDWLAARTVTRHHHVRIGDRSSMARLARVLTNNAVALVLAGGGARGFAHLGIIRALRECGLEVDAVGGCSFGALAATGLARGMRDDEILKENHFALTHDDPLGDYTIPIVSLILGERLDRMLRKYLPMDIEDLWIPFFSISTDLSSNQMRVHDRGPFWRAVRASVAVPGILPPMLEKGHLLIDGAVVNNLPVDVMRERVRGHVIAVNLDVEGEYVLEREDVPRGLEYIKSRLMPWRAPVDAPTISKLIIKATTLVSRKEIGNIRKLSDLYLNPPVDAYDFLAWNQLREIADVGYAYALPEIEAWAKEHPNLLDRHAQADSWWSDRSAEDTADSSVR